MKNRMKKVFGQIGRLKRECIDEYRRLHEQDVYTPRWKGVLSLRYWLFPYACRM